MPSRLPDDERSRLNLFGAHMAKLLQRTGSLLRKPGFTKAWLLPIWLMLGASRLAIITITFRRLAPLLGHPVGLNAYSHLLTPQQETRAIQIFRAIRLTARYCPWVANCFPQAVTARIMLGLYGIPHVLYFGLLRDSASHEFKAHAWVTAGRIPVSGGYSFDRYTIVACYLKQTP